MAVHLTQGDLLEADAEALVNAVNCVGVMSKGIALQFKETYPENFRQYRIACRRGNVQPGQMFVTETGAASGPRYLINFPTKRHWMSASLLRDIETGLADLVRVVTRKNIASLALPALGCGHGGLDWAEVRPRIEAAFASLPEVRVLLYAPE